MKKSSTCTITNETTIYQETKKKKKNKPNNVITKGHLFTCLKCHLRSSTTLVCILRSSYNIMSSWGTYICSNEYMTYSCK